MRQQRERKNTMRRFELLVIDDEEGMRSSLKRLLEQRGFSVRVSDSARKALSVLARQKIDLVICDIVMPEISGLLFLSRVDPRVPVVMITAYASVETARRAFKSGAADYLVKPFDFDELLVVINQCLSRRGRDNRGWENQYFLSSQNADFQRVIELAGKFSNTDFPVLILGESGTGKEVIADYIHERSCRRAEAYIKINCAAIPETLLKSELFGYEKGSFTGAMKTKTGKLEEANGGVILFDEIGDMNLLLQAKLLRVLQDFEFTRIGGNRAIKIDCRVIASSNKDFRTLIDEGRFRDDLYHRLNGLVLEVPLLRERSEDLENLMRFFLEGFNTKYGKKVKGFDTDTLNTFRTYSWPGNVRELRNCIERALVVSEGDFITLQDLPDSVRKQGDFSEPYAVLQDQMGGLREDYSRKLILDLLEKVNGNKSEAARVLGISRKTLYKWIHRLRIKHEYT
jgi:DNA-binding NtrC family response regulator